MEKVKDRSLVTTIPGDTQSQYDLPLFHFYHFGILCNMVLS